MKTIFGILTLVIIQAIWTVIVQPWRAEMAYSEYRKAGLKRDIPTAEQALLRALEFDSGNTMYRFRLAELYATQPKMRPLALAYTYSALENNNGDIVIWGILGLQGLLHFQSGDVRGAKLSFERANWYYPEFEPAKKGLEQVNKILSENSQILIKLGN